MKNKKFDLLVLTEYFIPDVASTGQLMHDLVRELHASRGIRTQVITSQPHYDADQPTPARESFTWGEVRRVPASTQSRQSIPTRVMGFIILFVRMLMEALKAPRIPMVLVSGNPPTLPLVALLLGRIHGQRYHVLIDDIYPEVPVAVGKMRAGGLIERFWHLYNALIYSGAEGVITIGDCMKELLLDIHPTVPITVAPYWAVGEVGNIPKDESEFAGAEGLVDKFVVLYSGNHGRLHNLDTLLDLAELLEHDGFEFVFVGSGAKRPALESDAEARGLTNVRFYPYQPMEKLNHTLAAGDVGVVCLGRGMGGLCVPSKTWGILASGRPVLALVDRASDIARVVKEANCGVVVASDEDLNLAVETLQKWRESPELARAAGQRGLEYLNRFHTVERSASLYAQALFGARQ